MKVALVHEWLTNVSGSERVLLELKKIFPDAPIYTSVFDPEKAKPFANFEVHTTFLQKLPLVKKRRELLVPLTPFAFEQFDLSGYDLVVSNSTMAAKGVLTKPGTLHLSYCHTPPRYLWEPSLDPRADNGRFSWLRKRVAHGMRIWDRVAAERVDYFLGNSEYIVARIKKYYQRDAQVMYPPVDVERFNDIEAYDPEDYFLFVSRLVDYKKCDIIVQAFNELQLPLKVIGQGPEKKFLQSIAKSNIEFLGFLTDEEVKSYYAKARAFIFAAEEDFGIVPVEAMAAGRPVIAYAAGGTKETVISGLNGEFFYEQTAKSLVEVVRNFDHTKYDKKRIRESAQKYSSENFRKKFSEIVEQQMKNRR